MVFRVWRKTSKAVREGGLLLVLIRLLQKVHFILYRNSGLYSAGLQGGLVKKSDLLKADWVNHPHTPEKVTKDRYTTAWIMSPPGKGSGGHLSIFRFLQFLEKAGHAVDIYLYTNTLTGSLESYEATIRTHFPKVAASVRMLGETDKSKPYDAVFATGWETAYPVFGFTNAAQKFYFVQDFEPYFYPTGSESVLAENTYKFGFYGITAGGWLTKKLYDEYGMQADYFTFGIDHHIYNYENISKRKDVFFYARPVTARRAFELGIFALEEFARLNPDVVIHLAGWDLSGYSVPFKHVSHGVVTPKELSGIYNKCVAGLVLSLTNMSLLPPELLACGTIPVINTGDNNKLVYDSAYYKWTETGPSHIVESLESVLNNDGQQETAQAAANSVANLNWESSGDRFIKIFERQMKLDR